MRKQQAAATRSTLVAIARRLFAENGFHATGVSELVAAAGMTRGALYHHFADKEDLFEAVFRDVAAELFGAAADRVRGIHGDPWRMLQEGLKGALSLVASSREIQRIVLLDGPAVLGWSRWREVHSEFTFAELHLMLDRLVEAGVMAPQPTAPLASLLLAALNDAAMSIAHAQDPVSMFEETAAALMTLVSGLRRGPDSGSSAISA
jgi:AcrR family transcriptional regulator